MRRATVSDLRYNFSRLEAWLSQGEEIELTRRGRVVGRILPVAAKSRKLQMPDFAARAKALSGGRIIATKSLLDYAKGPW